MKTSGCCCLKISKLYQYIRNCVKSDLFFFTSVWMTSTFFGQYDRKGHRNRFFMNILHALYTYTYSILHVLLNFFIHFFKNCFPSLKLTTVVFLEKLFSIYLQTFAVKNPCHIYSNYAYYILGGPPGVARDLANNNIRYT